MKWLLVWVPWSLSGLTWNNRIRNGLSWKGPPRITEHNLIHILKAPVHLPQHRTEQERVQVPVSAEKELSGHRSGSSVCCCAGSIMFLQQMQAGPCFLKIFLIKMQLAAQNRKWLSAISHLKEKECCGCWSAVLRCSSNNSLLPFLGSQSAALCRAWDWEGRILLAVAEPTPSTLTHPQAAVLLCSLSMCSSSGK